jgi:hypothetical protein
VEDGIEAMQYQDLASRIKYQHILTILGCAGTIVSKLVAFVVEVEIEGSVLGRLL